MRRIALKNWLVWHRRSQNRLPKQLRLSNQKLIAMGAFGKTHFLQIPNAFVD
jgi:hypothetical protein